MNPFKQLKQHVRHSLAELVRDETEKAIESSAWLIAQLAAFHSSPSELRLSCNDHTKDPIKYFDLFKSLRDRLVTLGVQVEDVEISVGDFESWRKEFAALERYYCNLPVQVEKTLEHYLSFTHLGIHKEDVLLDVAALGSPYADILRQKDVTAYRLDAIYKSGINGHDIGADAGDTLLPEGFASVLSLHCAFECFMGEADIRFIREAARLLRPGGRLGIVPLYLETTYFNTTSPYCEQGKITFDKDAVKIWRDDIWRVPFSRHYSPEAFCERIIKNMPGILSGRVLFFRNLPELIRHYGQDLYCYFMFCAEKKK